MRVTQQILVNRVLSNIRSQQNTILDLQTQLATGLRVNAPSDDPIDARRAINTRTTIATNQQYIDNISNTSAFLEEAATSVQTISDLLMRVRELTIQGANGTNAQEQLDSIAEEVNQLLETLLVTANHQTAGRYIFGGTRTLAEPFVATRDTDGSITAVSYEGNSEHIQVVIGAGVTVDTNEPGDAVFMDNVDLFQMLIDIRDNLLAGDQTSLQNDRLEELEDARQQIGQVQARVGAVQNRVERVSSDLEDYNLQLEELLSDSVDADFADVIIGLNAQSNAFQAALSAASSVIQPSLLDYIA
ncbi:MAG: flagellar hook-associated protein FlgL [Candidatus Hydrogenedentes bacterium]|nr:flagellar hook-associated protein FlgL [Candidatus Hydrogenedentota bacterium]